MLRSQRAMSLCKVVLLCIVYIHQVRGSDEYITGYSGQSVVLKSGADRSWNLTRVQWSIYKNTTFIASLKDGEVIIYKFWRHKGRLDLNNEMGDLTIRNVTMDDSMIYNVALVTSDGKRKQDKVHLTVQESLKTPDIQIQMLHSLNDSQCYIALECTAFGQNVNLSWIPDGEFNGSYISGIPNSVDSSLVLFASFSGNRNVTFNCTASSGQQTVTRQMTVGCSGDYLDSTQVAPVGSGPDTESQKGTASKITMNHILEKQYEVLTLKEAKLKLEIQKLELEKTKITLELQKLEHEL